jgi:hypothetical protein
MQNDPHVFKNLASDPKHAAEMLRLGKCIPGNRAPHAPKSKDRILEYRDGVPIWEGKVISSDDPIPGMD